jgi:heptosyltransferase I
MLSALGDAIQVLPVANALRRTFPNAHISWVLQEGPHTLVGDHPAVDEMVLFRRGPRFGSTVAGRVLSVLRAVQEIRSTAVTLGKLAGKFPDEEFDLLLDLQVYLKAGILTSLAPAKVKLGFDRRRARDLNWVFTTHRIPPHPSGFGHIQDQYFEFLRYLGVDPEPVEYGLRLSEEEQEAQRRFYSALDRPVCAMVVASSDPRKNWTVEGYIQVATELHTSLGLQPLLVGGHSAEEEKMARAILARSGPGVLDAREGGLRRLLWLLDGAALVISPDTGPLHMARAMEVPVVGLYGFTNPKRSGPYRRFADLVVDGYARFPGEAYGTNNTRRRGGMGRIRPEMVMEKVVRALRS